MELRSRIGHWVASGPVNTMESMHQAEHAREVAAIEEVVHGDSAQITAALQALRAEIAALRSMLAAQRPR